MCYDQELPCGRLGKLPLLFMMLEAVVEHYKSFEVQRNSAGRPAEGSFPPAHQEVEEVNRESICRLELATDGIQSPDGWQPSANEDQEVLTCSTSNLDGYQVGLLLIRWSREKQTGGRTGPVGSGIVCKTFMSAFCPMIHSFSPT